MHDFHPDSSASDADLAATYAFSPDTRRSSLMIVNFVRRLPGECLMGRDRRMPGKKLPDATIGALRPWESVGMLLRYVKAAGVDGVIMLTQVQRIKKSTSGRIERRVGDDTNLLQARGTSLYCMPRWTAERLARS
ncbi:MAG: hypothetical protein HYX64_02175 [Gammaproteobacteria bacterium]|nr:hypothetical protein [Gammaproteobacteria bacterium]